MKTVKLTPNEYFSVEQIIKKIAKDNGLDSVSKVTVSLNKESGIVKFAIIDDWADYDEEGKEILHTQGIEEDSEEDGSKYGPYEFRITYQTVTPESAEVGEYEDQGWELQDGQADDMDDLIHQLDNYGFYQDNSPGILDELSFSTVSPTHDRAYFEEGEETYYTVFIKREDGQDFEQKEADEIKQRLGVR